MCPGTTTDGGSLHARVRVCVVLFFGCVFLVFLAGAASISADVHAIVIIRGATSRSSLRTTRLRALFLLRAERQGPDQRLRSVALWDGGATSLRRAGQEIGRPPVPCGRRVLSRRHHVLSVVRLAFHGLRAPGKQDCRCRFPRTCGEISKPEELVRYHCSQACRSAREAGLRLELAARKAVVAQRGKHRVNLSVLLPCSCHALAICSCYMLLLHALAICFCCMLLLYALAIALLSSVTYMDHFSHGTLRCTAHDIPVNIMVGSNACIPAYVVRQCDISSAGRYAPFAADPRVCTLHRSLAEPRI